MKNLLLVIDMQNDFIDGSLGSKEAEKIVPKVSKEIETALKNNTAIAFTLDTHTEDYLNTQEGKKLPVKHCIKPEKGWELSPLLQDYQKKGKTYEKPTFGCTALLEDLKPYDKITLIGLCTDICVIANALLIKSFYPEKQIAVKESCCAGVTPQSHANALEAMKMCQIDII